MMTINLPRFVTAALLGAALTAPVALMPAIARADDRVYHDKARSDDHRWDSHEDRAYRMWVKENHRKYRDFDKLKRDDQDRYWAWRHEHSNAQLKIDIR